MNEQYNNKTNVNWSVPSRGYDPGIGRFTGVDPKADKYSKWSTYSYTLNNPIIHIDPTGMFPVISDWIDNEDGTYTAEKGDGAWTLAQDAGISYDRAKQVMEDQGHGTYVDSEDGIEKSAVDPGDVVTIPEQKEDVERKESIEAKKSKINSLNSKKSEFDRKEYSVQRDMDLTNKTTLNKNAPTDFGSGVIGFIFGEIIKQVDRELTRNKYDGKSDSMQNEINKTQKSVDSLKGLLDENN